MLLYSAQADLCLGLAYSIESLLPLYCPTLDTPTSLTMHRRLTSLLHAHRSDALLKRSLITTLTAYCERVCANAGVTVSAAAPSTLSVAVSSSHGDVLVLNQHELTMLLSTWALSPFIVSSEVNSTLQMCEALCRVTPKK